MVAEDERQRAISLKNQVVPEPATFKEFQRRDNNFRSSKEKYMAKQEKQNKQNDECTFCKKTGPKREGCFKLVGYPDWWPGKKDDKAKPKAAYVETGTSPIPGLNEGKYQEFIKFFSRSSNNVEAKPEANMAGNKDDVWVVDSGCTEYITHKSNLLENNKGTSNEAPIVIPNGHAIPVDGKGDFILPRGAKINGVLHIPNFKHNLHSVSRICKDLQSLDCNTDEPTKVHDDFKSTNFFSDSGEQILGPEIKEDHAISHKEPEPRSKRIQTQPAYVCEYVVNLPLLVTNSQPSSNKANLIVHPISHFVSYDKFSHSHKASSTTISSNHEPSCFDQATQDEKWRNAMQQEIKDLEKNGTWTLEELPEGKRPIDSNGSIRQSLNLMERLRDTRPDSSLKGAHTEKEWTIIKHLLQLPSLSLFKFY
nr:Gag-pre-integrase domain, Gag-polypeptide of LTR copia-type [Tanacetum cinerariifolium]